MNYETQIAVARALLDIGAVGFNLKQPIKFKSGIISPVYVDNRRLIYHPAALQTVITAFQSLVEAIEAEVIAGVAVGGVPYSAILGYVTGTPSVFVRKEPKEHGKGQQIEGGEITRRRVLLVEDLVTTGGSSLKGVMALRDGGATVTDCIAIVTYGFDETWAQFAAAGVSLHVLTPFEVIRAEAVERGLFDTDTDAVIADWFADPHGWAARHGKDTL